MRPNLVVVASPVGDGLAGLLQSLEPVLVEALVAELAVEALDAAVLHELARLDQQMSHVMLDRLTAVSYTHLTLPTSDLV